ncbi:hypothetical protein KC669_02405 [Candidatus Dojkabacteria bacterium]|uniref:Uncharacterized protein n=1 Tax=Candidatus Dojkabacteria bacterium TaxID=2099670 RepID=A0A955LAZ8_9BACT|nr:hypothetical protein [Candidatus Dojkabacteria bacterium]
MSDQKSENLTATSRFNVEDMYSEATKNLDIQPNEQEAIEHCAGTLSSPISYVEFSMMPSMSISREDYLAYRDSIFSTIDNKKIVFNGQNIGNDVKTAMITITEKKFAELDQK